MQKLARLLHDGWSCGGVRPAFLAIAKTGDEAEVLGVYRKSRGRKNVIDLITEAQRRTCRTGSRPPPASFPSWRDDAAHGLATPHLNANARGMRELLELCQWADKEWQRLTTRTTSPSS